jgi:hypothetical protein
MPEEMNGVDMAFCNNIIKFMSELNGITGVAKVVYRIIAFCPNL